MKLRDRFGQLDRTQKSTVFKIAATIVVVLAAALLIGYALINNEPPDSGLTQRISELPATVRGPGGEEVANPQLERLRQVRQLVNNAQPGVLLAAGSAIVGAMLVLVVWLGFGLVFPVLVALAIGAWFLLRDTGWEIAGSVAVGMIVLTLSFMVLMRGLALLLSYPHPVFAIARNVLAEAVRMKVSLVFIVMLFFVLAALPMLLNDDQSLRYRVQSFLQYSSGFTFIFVALLVVFFGAATVTYEQREKVIWQTMTKPVAAWQYLLGKWLGVASLAAVLLAVSASGVFLFTEYLRNQPATGEVEPYLPQDGSEITEDRLILETQVLTSRLSRAPLAPYSIDDEIIDQALEERIARERQLNPNYNPDLPERNAIRVGIFNDLTTEHFSIDPRTEAFETFVFVGLSEAKAQGLPLTLRYKINAEGNRPDVRYILTFMMEDGTVLPPRRTGLGFSHTLTLAPDFINDDGRLMLQILNGQYLPDPGGRLVLQTNQSTITIPPDGLEVSYSVGGYRANFMRVFFVLWVKLAMLGMLAVWASTFSSFPVACLIAGGLFFIGQSAGFVQDALPGWGKTNVEGDPSIFRTIIYYFADWVSSLFTVYNELRPTWRLAEGRMLPWSSVSRGVLALGAISAVFYAAAVLIFRKRQLAIYSGA